MTNTTINKDMNYSWDGKSNIFTLSVDEMIKATNDYQTILISTTGEPRSWIQMVDIMKRSSVMEIKEYFHDARMINKKFHIFYNNVETGTRFKGMAIIK